MRALAINPEFLVFDEPTTALDIRTRAPIVDPVRELRGRIGLSVLFITHDLNSARSLAHNVAIMRLGKIVAHGETEWISRFLKDPFARMLLSAELLVGAEEEGELGRKRLKQVAR